MRAALICVRAFFQGVMDVNKEPAPWFDKWYEVYAYDWGLYLARKLKLHMFGGEDK